MQTQYQSSYGRYEVIREIGSSNDLVVEGYDPLADRRVAIKLLRHQPGDSDATRALHAARFQREARAVGRLSHPNIMAIFDVGEQNGEQYLVIELLEGESLQSAIDAGRLGTTSEALGVVRQILLGLEHAHAKGVVHRDLKPANVWVQADGTVKLIDFGIAALSFDPTLTQFGDRFGSPQYMSPEQWQGVPVDHRTDLWSLGCIAYRMLVGVPPFEGTTMREIERAVLTEVPRLPPSLDSRVRGMLTKALQKDRAARFQSAAEMLSALDGVLGTAQANTPTPSPAPVVRPKGAQPQILLTPSRDTIILRYAIAVLAAVLTSVLFPMVRPVLLLAGFGAAAYLYWRGGLKRKIAAGALVFFASFLFLLPAPGYRTGGSGTPLTSSPPIPAGSAPPTVDRHRAAAKPKRAFHHVATKHPQPSSSSSAKSEPTVSRPRTVERQPLLPQGAPGEHRQSNVASTPTPPDLHEGSILGSGSPDAGGSSESPPDLHEGSQLGG